VIGAGNVLVFARSAIKAFNLAFLRRSDDVLGLGVAGAEAERGLKGERSHISRGLSDPQNTLPHGSPLRIEAGEDLGSVGFALPIGPTHDGYRGLALSPRRRALF
jgi:hypothetical protein